MVGGLKAFAKSRQYAANVRASHPPPNTNGSNGPQQRFLWLAPLDPLEAEELEEALQSSSSSRVAAAGAFVSSSATRDVRTGSAALRRRLVANSGDDDDVAADGAVTSPLRRRLSTVGGNRGNSKAASTPTAATAGGVGRTRDGRATRGEGSGSSLPLYLVDETDADSVASSFEMEDDDDQAASRYGPTVQSPAAHHQHNAVREILLSPVASSAIAVHTAQATVPRQGQRSATALVKTTTTKERLYNQEAEEWSWEGQSMANGGWFNECDSLEAFGVVPIPYFAEIAL